MKGEENFMSNILQFVPKLKCQSSYRWDEIKRILEIHEIYSFDEIINILKDIVLYWDDDKQNQQRRQCIWILILLADAKEQKNTSEILSLMREWGIDEAIFYEMIDTVKTYKTLEIYQSSVEAWDQNLKAELENNKKDLDRSIQNLIELG